MPQIYGYAIAGKARSGAARSGYVPHGTLFRPFALSDRCRSGAVRANATTGALCIQVAGIERSYHRPNVGYTSQYAPAIFTDGPLAYWRLNDTLGTVAVESIHNLNGTITGGVTLGASGALGDTSTAMGFNGTTGKITTAASIAIPQVVTMEAWIQTTTRTPVLRSWCTARSTNDLFVGINQSGAVVVPFITAGGSVTQGTREVADGRWHHVVVVVTATTATIYVDGTLDASAPHTRPGGGTGAIGIGYDTIAGREWLGAIDEVAIYPYALTPAQASSHYMLGAYPTPQVSPDMILSASIADVVDDTPNHATFTVEGFTPTVGMDVVMRLGSINNLDRIFAGQIANIETSYVDTLQLPIYTCNAIDYTAGLNKRLVIQRFQNQRGDVIAKAIMTGYTSGYTTANVQSGLDVIDEISFTNDRPASALSSLAKRLGEAYWKIDYQKDLHFGLEDTSHTPPRVLNAAHASAFDLRVLTDVQQWVTRVYGEGGGANAFGAVGVGETTLPVEAIAWYQATGGVVACGPQRLTYSGLDAGGGGSLVGPGAAPTGAPNVAVLSGVGVTPGLHNYAVTYVTAAGESLAGPLVAITTGVHEAPATVPTIGAPTIGTGPDPGYHMYACSFLTASGETMWGPSVVEVTTGLTPAPVEAPVPGTATAGPGVDDGNHDYAVTFVTSIGETTIGPIGGMTTTGPMAAPGPIGTIDLGTSGTGPDTGSHDYACTFVTAFGETLPGGRVTKITNYLDPPPSAPTFGLGTSGTGPEQGAHDYAVTFANSAGETPPGPIGTKVTDGLTVPATPALTFAGPTGGLGPNPGAHTYAVTFVTSVGETLAGAHTVMTASGYLAGAPSVAPSIGNNTTLSNINTYWNAGAVIQVAIAYYTGPGNSATATTPGPASNQITAAHHYQFPTGTAAPYLDITGIYTSTDPNSNTRIYYMINGVWTCFEDIGRGYSSWQGPSNIATYITVPVTINNAWVSRHVVATIPLGPAGTTQRKLYRTPFGGAGLQLVTTIADNTTTTVADTTLDSALGATPPTVTGVPYKVNHLTLPTGPSGTTRNVYRTALGSSQLKLLGTGVSTSYTDSTPDAGLGANAPTGNTAALNVNHLSDIPTGPSGTTQRNLYRTALGSDANQAAAIEAATDAKTTAAAAFATPTTVNYNTAAVSASVAANKFQAVGIASSSTAATAFNNSSAGLTQCAQDPANQAYKASAQNAVNNANIAATTAINDFPPNPQLRYLDKVSGNYSTTYTDTKPDGLLGANAPTSNTATINQIPLSQIPKGDSNVSARKLYRRSAGAGLRYVTTIPDNTHTTYTDTTPNASLGAAPPTASGAHLQVFALADIPRGDALVTGRRVYRTIAGGGLPFKLVTTIADNTTKVFTDTVPDASLGAAAPATNTATTQQVALTGIPTGAPAVTNRKLYRTIANGVDLKLLGMIAGNTTTTYTDTTPDASLGGAPPGTDTSGLAQPSGNVVQGSTTLIVATAAPFRAGGGWAVIGNGQQCIRYFGLTASALTGIPATGPGAILATVSYNSTVTVPPTLTGIPASGPGAIKYPIVKGDAVNLLVQVDDPVGQAALAGFIGGDGIQEEYWRDNRLSYTETLARCHAQLELQGMLDITIGYKCRDRNTTSGSTLPVNLGPPFNLLGHAFKVQSVTISGFTPNLMPLFDVTASVNRFTFEDLLKLARKAA